MDPTYYNLRDHTEAVDVDFDPNTTSYEKLLAVFWKHHDPTRHCNRHYMSAIFYHDNEQRVLADNSLKQAKKNILKQLTTVILPASEFYEAETYHQKYLLQQHPMLIKCFGISNVVMSHVCTRINGYVGSYGKIKDFDKEWDTLGLNEQLAEYVRKQMIKNCCASF